MAEFRAIPQDLREVIARQQWTSLKRQGVWPLGALAASAVLLVVYRPLAFVLLGVGLAWAMSAFSDWHSIPAAYLWRYAWLLEDARIDIQDEGVHVSTSRGSSFIRWDSGVVVTALATCYVLEDEGEDLAVLPKRYLNSTELLLLQNRVAVT